MITIKEFGKLFSDFYKKMYNGEMPEKSGYVDMGDEFIRGAYNGLAKTFITYRQDILSSDREVAAFYLATLSLLEQGYTKEQVNAIEPPISVYDKNGQEINVGNMVVWRDPETHKETSYQVYDIREDMVKLISRYGECEALPEECEIMTFNC